MKRDYGTTGLQMNPFILTLLEVEPRLNWWGPIQKGLRDYRVSKAGDNTTSLSLDFGVTCKLVSLPSST